MFTSGPINIKTYDFSIIQHWFGRLGFVSQRMNGTRKIVSLFWIAVTR